MQGSSITQHFYVRFIFVVILILFRVSDCIHMILINSLGNAMCFCGDPATGSVARVKDLGQSPK